MPQGAARRRYPAQLGLDEPPPAGFRWFQRVTCAPGEQEAAMGLPIGSESSRSRPGMAITAGPDGAANARTTPWDEALSAPRRLIEDIPGHGSAQGEQDYFHGSSASSQRRILLSPELQLFRGQGGSERIRDGQVSKSDRCDPRAGRYDSRTSEAGRRTAAIQ